MNQTCEIHTCVQGTVERLYALIWVLLTKKWWMHGDAPTHGDEASTRAVGARTSTSRTITASTTGSYAVRSGPEMTQDYDAGEESPNVNFRIRLRNSRTAGERQRARRPALP